MSDEQLNEFLRVSGKDINAPKVIQLISQIKSWRENTDANIKSRNDKKVMNLFHSSQMSN